jgi:hypothetical protein
VGCGHPGELVAKVGYFGVKSTKVHRVQIGAAVEGALQVPHELDAALVVPVSLLREGSGTSKNQLPYKSAGGRAPARTSGEPP